MARCMNTISGAEGSRGSRMERDRRVKMISLPAHRVNVCLPLLRPPPSIQYARHALDVRRCNCLSVAIILHPPCVSKVGLSLGNPGRHVARKYVPGEAHERLLLPRPSLLSALFARTERNRTYRCINQPGHVDRSNKESWNRNGNVPVEGLP